MLLEENIEGALQVLEDLAEVTEHPETPTFPRDLDIAIGLVNQTVTQLVDKLDMKGSKLNKVSCVILFLVFYRLVESIT